MFITQQVLVGPRGQRSGTRTTGGNTSAAPRSAVLPPLPHRPFGQSEGVCVLLLLEAEAQHQDGVGGTLRASRGPSPPTTVAGLQEPPEDLLPPPQRLGSRPPGDPGSLYRGNGKSLPSLVKAALASSTMPCVLLPLLLFMRDGAGDPSLPLTVIPASVMDMTESGLNLGFND